MSEEKTNAEVIIEDEKDKDYNDILEKFETPENTKSGTKEKKGHIKALIFSLLGVVVLIGVVLFKISGGLDFGLGWLDLLLISRFFSLSLNVTSDTSIF